MSSEEKRTWIYVVVAVGIAAVYFATVVSKVPGTDVATIAYVRPMITAIVVAIVPLDLAMAEIEQFWIANALYLAFVLAALASSIVKIVAYRRGF